MKGKPSAKTLDRLNAAHRDATRAGDHELRAILRGQIARVAKQIDEQPDISPPKEPKAP